MNWQYKGVDITVNKEGLFTYIFNDKEYKSDTLSDAKTRIDDLQEYYTFTQNDMDELLSKLNDREKGLIRSLYQELHRHSGSVYCRAGLDDYPWNWKWDLTK